MDNLEDYDDFGDGSGLSRDQIIGFIETMKMGKSSKDCSICCCEFKKGEYFFLYEINI